VKEKESERKQPKGLSGGRGAGRGEKGISKNKKGNQERGRWLVWKYGQKGKEWEAVKGD